MKRNKLCVNVNGMTKYNNLESKFFGENAPIKVVEYFLFFPFFEEDEIYMGS